MIPVFFLICMGIGRYSVSLMEIFRTISGNSVDSFSSTVLLKIRFPRLILAAFAGAGLACSGASFQGVFSNPLATPDTVGVASGSAFGAVLAMIMQLPLGGIQFFSVCSGILACLITVSIGRVNGKSSLIMMILSGIMVSALFQALISIVKYIADPEDLLPSITYWLMGSLSSVSVKYLTVSALLIIAGILVIWLLRWKINILSMDEDEAKSLGVNVTVYRIVLIIAASVITSSCVSLCGQIGWVGLLIPHMARLICGSDNRNVIPLSISIGAIFMMLMDTLARSLTSVEIPVSVLTAIVGAPVFIILLRKSSGKWL